MAGKAARWRSREAGANRETMTTRYELIIYWSKEDDSFVVEVPELPGCMADGQTYAEAVTNAEVVIDEWIETARKLGRPIPEPRGKLAYA
jgi:predicted RNase H-like HicB family nuclease